MIARFDDFTADSERRQLMKNGAEVHLTAKALDLLLILIARRPNVVGKIELFDLVWPDTVVAESNLPTLINDLRDALGDDAKRPRYIRTVHRFGYAFAADAEVEGEAHRPHRQAVARLITKESEYPLFRGRNLLGREGEVDVILDDPTVSRRHAVIVVSDAGTRVEDLRSKNGTFVDGKRVAGAADLVDHATLTFGTVAVTYRASAGADSTVTV